MEITYNPRSRPPDCDLSLTGELDLATADALRQALDAQINAGNIGLRLDMTGVSFMDSSGLHVLAWAYDRTRGVGGRLTLHPVSRPVERILRLTRATTLLESA